MLPGDDGPGGQRRHGPDLRVRGIVANPDPGKPSRRWKPASASIAGTIGPLLVVVVRSPSSPARPLQGGIHLKKFTASSSSSTCVNGIKRMFGAQALWGGAKALLKTGVVGLVLYTVMQGLLPVLLTAGGLPVSRLVDRPPPAASAALLQSAVIAGLVLAAADVFVVMRRNRKKTRMTKKEVKDENKNTDGDPLIKSQRRARQLAMSRNRMIAAIADADVVLVNPTHVAVALRYEPGKSAPRVVAKGAGHIAARIREEAEAKKVPMVKDIPLTRALHAACELGHEIPVELLQRGRPRPRVRDGAQAPRRRRRDAPHATTAATVCKHGRLHSVQTGAPNTSGTSVCERTAP